MRPPFCCSSSALLEEVVNMLRGLDELLNDRRNGPDHCAEDCPEQDGEDNVDDVEHDGGCLLWVDGWLGAGRRNPRRLRAGERRSAAQIHITRVRAPFHRVETGEIWNEIPAPSRGDITRRGTQFQAASHMS